MEIKILNEIKYQKFFSLFSFSLTWWTKGTNAEIKMYKNYLDINKILKIIQLVNL